MKILEFTQAARQISLLCFAIGLPGIMFAGPLTATTTIEADQLHLGSIDGLDFDDDIDLTLPDMTGEPGLFATYSNGLNPIIDGELDDHDVANDNNASTTSLLMRFVEYPNEFSNMVIQAIYWNDTSTGEFTADGYESFLTGGTITSISHVDDYYGTSSKKIHKEVVGTQVLGLHTGGTGKTLGGIRGVRDDFRMNLLSSGIVALDNTISLEETTDWRYRRWFVESVIGGIFEAMISPPRSADARAYSGTTVPGRVEWLIGSEGINQIDMGTSDSKSYDALARQDIPHILVSDSFINFGTLRGSKYSLFDPHDSHDTELNSSVSENSSIKRWTGIASLAPNITDENEKTIVPSSAGLSLHRQTDPPTEALKTQRTRRLMRRFNNISHKDSFIEKTYPSIDADGIMVIGDGDSDSGVTGYDTDALHIRGYLKFNPYITASAGAGIDAQVLKMLPPSEQAGIIYYDPEKPTNTGGTSDVPGLYVSVVKNDGSITWRKLEFDLDHVEIRGSDNEVITTPSAADLETALRDATDEVKTQTPVIEITRPNSTTITAWFYHFSATPTVSRSLIQSDFSRGLENRIMSTGLLNKSTEIDYVVGTSPAVYSTNFTVDPNLTEIIIHATDPFTNQTSAVTVLF